MASVQDLQKLRDIHLPKPPGFWPMAPGWYCLAVMLLFLLGTVMYLLVRRHRRLRPKREALKLLMAYERQYAAQGSAAVISAKISELLKRLALVYFPRQEVASLHGDPWIEFLGSTSRKIDFNEVRVLLLEVPYGRETTQVNLQALFRSAKSWIKQRGVPCLN